MAEAKELHVVFGAGPVGLATVRALLRRNHRVRVVSRSGKLPPTFEGVEVVAADALNPVQAREVVKGAHVVYQCAQSAYTRWPRDFPPLQRAILNATAEAGAKLVLADNLYMYGEVHGPIHEDLPYAAATRKGKVRAAMAEEALAAHQEGRVRVAVGRASDFYGPFVLESALGERVFKPLLKGKSAQLGGDIDLRHSYTFIHDFGEALAILGERQEADAQAWHVPNAEARSTRELVSQAFAIADKKPKMSSAGRTAMRLIGLFNPGARESVEMMYAYEKPYVVDDGKFKRAFGDISTPFEEGLEQTLSWYQQTH